MQKRSWLLISLMVLLTITACGNNADEDTEELAMLEVEFEVPESLEVGETLKLEAVVTYGDEMVTDADEVIFEVWEKGDRENGKMIDAENNGDGTYTAETSFGEDGIFEMYAHTTARSLHTMPKREVVVGKGSDYEDVEEASGFQTEGFDMHFMEPEDVAVDEETELMVHLMLNDEEFEHAYVRYEIWNNNNPDDRDWVDAGESTAGEYIASYIFTEDGTYNIQIHVEDDDELHEHEQHQIEIND